MKRSFVRPAVLALAFAALAIGITVLPPTPAQGATFTCTNTDNGGGNFTLTCLSGPPPGPGAPSGCSITSNPPSLPTTGGSINLTAQCSGGAAVDTWAWTGPTSTRSGNTATANLTVTTQFSVNASNAGGSASANLVVQVATGGGGGGGGPIACGAPYANTRLLDIAWPKSGSQVGAPSASVGGFGANDALVVRFTTPASTAATLGSISVAEYQGPPAGRIAKLSAQACDFGTGSPAQTLTKYFTVGPNQFGAAVLQPSTTYYLNVHNDSSCTGTCDVLVSLQSPQ